MTYTSLNGPFQAYDTTSCEVLPILKTTGQEAARFTNPCLIRVGLLSEEHDNVSNCAKPPTQTARTEEDTIQNEVIRQNWQKCVDKASNLKEEMTAKCPRLKLAKISEEKASTVTSPTSLKCEVSPASPRFQSKAIFCGITRCKLEGNNCNKPCACTIF